ncbi:PHD and RING finger domain-containing protein 1 isoform X3 [Pteropus alecto]|uniref:PHD and RING finger domain-containing protein 1 isoform X3 n=1 Tax=Pteropus alecto TaxID=9402 RepID=UPI0007689A0F|nr:PHD and RING finger domain-containing protein 1 isoform X3 [Pteropus alecto]
MDDDSLDEFEDQSPGPDVHPQLSTAALARDAESSDSDSGGSEDDTGSELSDSSDGEDEEGDLEDGSGSEGSEDDDDVDIMADAQGRLEASGALNSDDDSESCPICLNTFRGQVVGTPQSCAHYFCLDCIVEWSKNANSCPVDRTVFKCICIRACYGGKILKKIPVQNARAAEDEDEDPTFCEVCGHSDREDRLLLCDSCDAGYHMECLEPPLREVPVDEWFCPECATPRAAANATDAGLGSEEEVSLLLADTVPTASRLRPRAGRTRAIARTRQSERVRATVNRNRMSTASRIQPIPRYLTSSLLDETIEAVASGLSTAVYQRPTTPRAPTKRRRRAGRRKRAAGRKKVQRRPSLRSKGSGTRSRRRQGRAKKRKGRTPKNEVTARCRIARTLGLRRPVRGACIPSVYKPADPSLGLLRADIGAASLSLFGDPYELDPFDSSEEPAANPASPLSAKRRALSRSALRSHRPVARPVSMGLSRRNVPAVAPEPEMDTAPVPDLLGSILSGQSLLLMDSADVTIHRDGSLSAKRAAPVSFQRNSAGPCPGGEGHGPGDGLRPGAPHSGCSGSLGSCCQGRPAPSCVPALTGGAAVRPKSSVAPRSSQAQNASHASSPGSKRHDSPQFNGDSKQALPLRFASKTSNSNLPSKSAGLGQAPRPALRPAPRRTDICELPRIPKIRRDDGGSRQEGPAPAPAPASGQQVSIPSSCISRLTGREGPGQPGLGTRADGEPRGRASQEPGVHSGSGAQPPGPLGPSRAKGSGTSFQSFRINIPGSAAHASRLPPPGFCDTFRPVDSKVPRKDSTSALFSLRKAKQLESEIYDPFDPTGSDSSSASSPERMGSGLLPSEITRTISVDSPRAAPLQAVRRVTSYTVEAGSSEEPGSPHGPSLDVLNLPGEEGPPEGQGPAARAQRLSPPGPWEDEDPPLHSSFFGAEERTVTCVTGTEPDVPPPAPPTHRVVELRAQPRSRSRSRSRSTSSSRGRKEARRKQAPAREPRRTRSGTRSGSRSGDGSSGSVSPQVGEDHTRRQQPKARSRRSSSEGSSSHERARRKKAKDKGRERSRGFRGPGRRRSRSRSGSPGSSSHEHRDSRRRRRRRSGSRTWGRGCSPPSSLDRAWRPHHPRERSRERPRDRRGSRERRKHRSRSPRSPSAEHRSREHRRPRSREKRPRPRSPERKPPVKGASPAPPPQEEPQPYSEPPAQPPALAGASASAAGAEAEALPRATAVPEVPAGCLPEDLDYGDSVEAGHVFEDFSGEGIFMQLDDMSSPPSPESTDSSPERAFPLNPAVPATSQHQDTSLAMAVIRREVSLMHGEDAMQPLPWAEGPQELLLLQRDSARAAAVPGTLGGLAVGQEEAPPQTPVLRAKAPVKRVTWNLEEAVGSALAEDRGQRMPLHRPQQPQEEAWETEDKGLVAAPQQAPLPEPPPHGHLLPEPGFLDADATQVYSPNLLPAPALPLSIPPYAPVSQPTVQFILQGSLPLAGCGVAQSPAPVPSILTTASEPAGHAAATNNSEERMATPRPAAEKAKNEEYMKKLHVQERAVEEVKLAIKPFYQRREVTKDEYKDILRKAVQKICHSKSGEINPVKVGNLVKAYVDKYRHMRRHRRPEASEEPAAQGAEG